MIDRDAYPTPAGVESAIKDAATKAAAADPSLDVNKRIQLEYFNRFLSRVFSEGNDSAWVLKGGTGILARVPSTRSTRDIDLYRQEVALTQALQDLIRLAAVDLGDHFRFEYAGHTDSIGADAQPYVDGYTVSFTTTLGSTRGAQSVSISPSGRPRQVTSPRPSQPPRSNSPAWWPTPSSFTRSWTRSPARSARR